MDDHLPLTLGGFMRVDTQWLEAQKADRLAACRRVSESRIVLVRQHLLPSLRAAFPVRTFWLFGSTARRTAGEDSDLDLLLICEETGERWMDRQARAIRVCQETLLPFACDAVVWTVSEWRHAQASGNGLWAAILADGERL
ncbi:nucleotidyltransferase domain-containing protein [Acidiferrobacter sp. SPIII_3]|jgi:predicted nucleotidyltransferase|uniref:nucleotidyltransferase family protein n=1 Tax=Acidiferrobacter sp. SPIII_3 TaxID=1281578 RepID=UPI000D72EF48|nr:nucleotidyltransferase domain-containing protein [Acidiferrobacter sp. SPIII_3]AWP23665.1 nucleotidyltransferase domain-containing protein [Acidiferrobacter sp. SPIII_3]